MICNIIHNSFFIIVDFLKIILMIILIATIFYKERWDKLENPILHLSFIEKELQFILSCKTASLGNVTIDFNSIFSIIPVL